MKNTNITIIIIIFITINQVFASDTLKLMHYNVLRFGLNDAGCDQNNNDIISKTNYISTIINYVRPDILTINEICDTFFYHTFFLYSVFNLNGFNNYLSGPVYGNYLTSQIFYNSQKIYLYKTEIIPTNINQYTRQSYAYTFYYRSKSLVNKDTVFFKIILTHLRAGISYENERAQQTSIIMNYLENNNVDNYFVMGDMNIYSSTELAYQNYTNYSINSISLIDPCLEGQWHNNEVFSLYHTQSTHLENHSCFSSGGLDDRFDFILYSKSIQNNMNKISYVPNSYKTIGQDGNHFKQSVNYENNLSAPTNVINALFQNSDHLPVCLDIIIEQNPINISNINNSNICFFINGNKILTKLTTNNDWEMYKVSIYNLNGKCILKDADICNLSSININTKNEIIIITIKSENHSQHIKYYIE